MSGPDPGDHDETDGPDDDSSDGSDRFGDPNSPADRRDSDADSRRADSGDPGTDDRFRADGTDSSGPSTTDGSPGGTRSANASTRDDQVTIEDDGVVRWFLRSEDETVVFVRDIVSSIAIVAVIGLLLFAVSGVWPPLVAVESGSMEPNMQRGDLIFVVDDDRFVGDDPVEGTGVVPLERGEESGDESFGQPGDVIIFKPAGTDRTPIIHRAHFWVEQGEDWVERADQDVVGRVTCEDVHTCPAEHAGFITKGDDNDGYDQYGGANTDVVKPEWITGKATFRIPWLGHIRLFFDDLLGGMVLPPGSMQSIAGLESAAGLFGPAGIAGVGTVAAAGGYRSRD
ncbi:S26 family signal peptidase [Halopiger goleimassiliensis]|uniref:S26 family signal peptidase n=1 Tax=Halopiger goleimassiliensis TaxID=1293048 RepID=UPI0006782E57|nr:S26 family signal peptidase [Halopiger goleimassiliensis]